MVESSSKLAKFDLRNKVVLGSGSFGSVFQVNKIDGSGPVAIKMILLPTWSWDDRN